VAEQLECLDWNEERCLLVQTCQDRPGLLKFCIDFSFVVMQAKENKLFSALETVPEALFEIRDSDVWAATALEQPVCSIYSEPLYEMELLLRLRR
jgi:hypothetical protein